VYLDILICLFLIVCLVVGWFRGFMGAVVGFMAVCLSFMVAFFLARPLANLTGNWFAFLGDSSHFMNILICGVIVFLIVRMGFFILSRYIQKLKFESNVIDKTDRIAGVFLGAFKFCFFIFLFFIVVYLLSVIPLVNSTTDWLVRGSRIGNWIFGIVRNIIT